MKSAVKCITKISFTLILIAALLLGVVYRLMLSTSGNERYFSGEAEAYYLSLIDIGFPMDYAAALTELHMLHPEWSFLPLDITELNSSYTWDYVIEQETKNPEINLVSPASAYQAYRHPTNHTKYDSGFYQASVESVSYFMDPRNFLNETDIFLFFDLASKEIASLDAIEAVLQGTFMENAVLENGMTYATYFQSIGQELGINAVYLAAKARQEQGVNGTSPIISGLCGTTLWEFYRDQKQNSDSGSQILPPSSGYSEEALKQLDGYYNFYNVKASGTGLFAIYHNAMNRAILGTEDRKAAWSGSASWDTKWKSIYGGAAFLKESYIDRYQSTVYLQKFNVDSRSDRNFYGQYMQSISGGLSESRSLYQSFASIECLDQAYTFLIPVYGEMPEQPCQDPANGTCANFAQATNRYSYHCELTDPIRVGMSSSPIYSEIELYEGQELKLTGVATHSYGLHELQYAWDFGKWSTASDSNQFDFSISADFSSESTHILLLRGKAAYDHSISNRKYNAYTLYAVIYVKIVEPPQVNLTYRVGNVQETQKVSMGETITLPTSESNQFAGWIGSDGSFLPSAAPTQLQSDVTFTALFLDLQMLEGAALSINEPSPHLRFSAILDERSYLALTALSPESFSIVPTIQSDTLASSQGKPSLSISTKETVGGAFVKISMDTAPLDESDYLIRFSAELCISLQYTNGDKATICAIAADNTRSAKSVAESALADSSASYSDQTIDFLKKIANVT